MEESSAEFAFLQSLDQNDTSTTEDGAPTESNQTPTEPPKQPQTLGGFVLDDDDDEEDDEDEEEEAPQLDSLKPSSNDASNIDRGLSETPQHSVADSSTPNTHAPAVPNLHVPQQDQAALSTTLNGTDDTSKTPDASIPASASAITHRGSEAKAAPVSPPGAPSISSSEKDTPVTKSRLPQDRVGILEDRIADDPRGDIDAWLSLIAEHKKRGKFDDVRKTYDRFLELFPTCAEQWATYCKFELDLNELKRLEDLFGRSLFKALKLDLWYIYLDYVRRRWNLATDTTGDARKTIVQTYEFMLQHLGNDPESGRLWQDYIQFVRQGPGQPGGSSWEDQQKMDSLRKTYQRAVCVPTELVQTLWKDYGTFENGLNKTTGNKFLQEKSPNYMSARIAYGELQKKTDGLKRTTVPLLPPAPGFEGHEEYKQQVKLWKTWIEWEKGDPLSLKADDLATYKARIIYTYKQALMALRFWPEMWFEAVDFCFQNGMEEQGDAFLKEATEANPESCLLAFQRGDRLESKTPAGDDPSSLKKKGDTVREPYDKVLNALYQLHDNLKIRESQLIARIREQFAAEKSESPSPADQDEAEYQPASTGDAREGAVKAQIDAVQKGNAAQLQILTKTISFAWIALMRAMRRIQGKGKQGDTVGGLRQIFAEGRKRGRVTSDFWIASALLEHTCYRDGVGTRLFERALKLFPMDEQLALAYLEHLMSINDTTNARAVFETTVSKLENNPETLSKAKPLYAFFHRFESDYGELAQIQKLEQRMVNLFPEDPRLKLFSQRYAAPTFDPTNFRPVISPATQTKPKPLTTALPGVITSIEKAPSVQHSPRPQIPQIVQVVNSPKRALEDSDSESLQPRKLARGDSPLKGAAGRRLDAQRRREAAQRSNPVQPPLSAGLPVPSLPKDVNHILSILPRADTYNIQVFSPERMVELIRSTDLNRVNPNALAALGRPPSQSAPGPQPMHYGYGQADAGYAFGR